MQLLLSKTIRTFYIFSQFFLPIALYTIDDIFLFFGHLLGHSSFSYTTKLSTFFTQTKHFLSLQPQIFNHHITFHENSETSRTHQTLF